jgi:hypothetical protein
VSETGSKTGPLELITAPTIEKRIFVVRKRQVMLDEDLADLYGVETKRLIEQVKRNLERFPQDFMFQLNTEEAAALRSQIATSNTGRGYARIEKRLEQIERGMGEHDEQLEQIFKALRQLISPPRQSKHPIGFRVRNPD